MFKPNKNSFSSQNPVHYIYFKYSSAQPVSHLGHFRNRIDHTMRKLWGRTHQHSCIPGDGSSHCLGIESLREIRILVTAAHVFCHKDNKDHWFTSALCLCTLGRRPSAMKGAHSLHGNTTWEQCNHYGNRNNTELGGKGGNCDSQPHNLPVKI